MTKYYLCTKSNQLPRLSDSNPGVHYKMKMAVFRVIAEVYRRFRNACYLRQWNSANF